ncbi:MAG: hypothetical protein NC548_50845 [Lachnospiraceae bacterium]|nr:hypothetical protein [Lachnospiraceae bacterium]
MLKVITNNPYRILGVLSNSPLRERVGNQNRLAAFAKVGKEVSFPNDFATVITDKPQRTSENISAANTALNLDKDQLKNAFFWFINASPIDGIALKHLQAGSKEKAREIFEKKETFSSLLNVGVIQLIDGNYASGFSNISSVIHNAAYRLELLNALGLSNLTLTEDEIASMFIEELLKEIPASVLISASTNPNDKAIISKTALDGPISLINSAIATAKSADSKNSKASLEAGTKLMNSTKKALKQVKDIAGASSPQYQMVADNLAKQILQCGINYYNNASDDDVEAPRKAMVLQKYALDIAVGQLTKDRCRENYKIIKEAVDNMPPAEVAIETRKVKDELRKFCALPNKISHSIALLNNTKPLLQTIKTKLGATNSFYLSLSTQVVGNALHNLIEEVNQVQNLFVAIVKAAKEAGLNPAMLNYLGDEHSPAKIIENKLKPVIREAWRATAIMDTFDMEADFRTNRYNVNRRSLKDMCDSLNISTYVSTPRTTPRTTPSRPTTTTRTTSSSSSHSSSSNSSKEKNSGWPAFWIATFICAVIGAMANGSEGFFCGGILGAMIVGNIARAIFRED